VTTQKPVVTTQRPVVTTQKPVVTTQKPVVTTQKGISLRYNSIARLDTYSMWYNQLHVFTSVHVFYPLLLVISHGSTFSHLFLRIHCFHIVNSLLLK